MAKTLPKPTAIKENKQMAKTWNKLVKLKEFSPADVSLLASLCYWVNVQDQCMSEIIEDGFTKTSYMNDRGEIKAMPQLASLKQATSEIRALCKQLGIADYSEAPRKEVIKQNDQSNYLQLVRSKRNARRAAN